MKTIFFCLALLSSLSSFGQVDLLVQTNGTLLQPTNFFAANIARLTNTLANAGYSGGGGGDVTQVGNNTFTGTNRFNNSTTISNLAVTTANVSSMTLAAPIGVTAVGTNAADARSALGVAYDVDVQAYRLGLLQAALALTANGHMIYHNGTLVTNLLSTTAGRSLLTAADASAQRTLLSVGQLTNLTYSVAWSNNTTQTPTLGVLFSKFESLPGGSNAISSWNPAYFSVSSGYLDWVGGTTGGGSGGYTYLLTNSLGAWQGRDASTNWTILSTTISSNDVPTATGRFLDGGWSLVASNNSGTTATLYLDVSVGGAIAFRDSYSMSSGAGIAQRPMLGQFWLVRETDTTASLVQNGQNVNANSTPVGVGDFGASANAVTIVSTNIPVTWSSNVQFSVSISCDTSTSTNAALGLRVVNAWLRKEAAASSEINADNITSGTLNSNRLPSAVAFTSVSVGTISATAVEGDASGLTNISGSNIASGTVAAARIDSAIARTNAPTLHSPVLLGSPTVPTAAAGTSNTVAASTKYVDDAVAAGGGGGSSFSPLDYYCDAEFMPSGEANLAYYGFPLLSGAAINSGAVAVASGATIAVPGLNGIIRIRNTTSANAGAFYLSDAASICITGNEFWGVTWYSQTTNLGTRLLVGMQDSKTVTAPVDGIYGEQVDNAFRFLAIANSVTNAGATTFYIPSNTICRATAQLSGTNSVAVALFTNGVSAFSETITGGLPAGTDRVVGVGVVTYHTNNVAQNLMYLDKVWFGKTSSIR